jgi:hypothetical protein
MPKIGQEKKDKISEQILHHLFSISPQAIFTSAISKEIARDEEFIKAMLTELEKKKLVVQVNKNKDGIDYLKRQRWRLSNQAFDVYAKHQSNQQAVKQAHFSSESQQSL